MDRFKENDSVKVSGNSPRAGESGTVHSQAVVGQGKVVAELYWVKFPDGTVELYKAEDLELESQH